MRIALIILSPSEYNATNAALKERKLSRKQKTSRSFPGNREGKYRGYINFRLYDTIFNSVNQSNQKYFQWGIEALWTA